MTRDSRRDLELIVFGMALHADTREEMLKDINPVLLSSEFSDLFESIAKNKPAKLVQNWLETRGAKLQKGRNARQAIVAAIQKSNAQSRLQMQVKTVERAMKVGTADQIADALQEALNCAKDLQEIEGV